MKSFNDEKINAGFQLDTSLLNPEQIEHVLKIFEARGINFHIGKPTKIKLDFSKNKIIEFEDGVLYQPDCSVKLKTPLIDYPTLCRGAVQLEVGNWCIANMEQCKKITGYSSIDVSVTQNDTSLFVGYHWQGGHSLKLSPEDFEDKLRGIYPVAKQSLTTETKRYMKAINSGFIVEVDKENGLLFSGAIVDPCGTEWEVGAKCNTFRRNLFEPCDYAPRSEAIHSEVKEHMIADAADRLHFEPVLHFETNDNALPNQSKVLGFEFSPEPVEVSPGTEQPNLHEADMAKARLVIGQELDKIWLKGYDFGIKKLEQENAQLREQKNKVSADWFDLTVKRAELEQRIAELEAKLAQNAELKETVAECGEKTLMDNPTIADHIGSHMNLAFKYAKELVNENTRLRGQLYRLPMLEQENAKLKERIAELEAQLIGNSEQLPVESVYDVEWLENALQGYNPEYRLSVTGTQVGIKTGENEDFKTYHYISAKDSAPIIIAALAKHLNGGKDVSGEFEVIVSNPKNYEVKIHQTSTTYHGGVNFAPDTAQKAIDILSTHFYEVLKNYLA